MRLSTENRRQTLYTGRPLARCPPLAGEVISARRWQPGQYAGGV
jgi:hypothetical protein